MMSSWAEMQYTKIEVSTGSIKGEFVVIQFKDFCLLEHLSQSAI